MAVISILIGLFLGYGAVEQFLVRGIREGLPQPAILGAAATVASALLIFSGVARLKRMPDHRRLALVAAALIVMVHAYGVLPPHRNVGMLAAVLGIGYGAVLLLTTALRGREERA